jgi:hypothetical protein
MGEVLIRGGAGVKDKIDAEAEGDCMREGACN